MVRFSSEIWNRTFSYVYQKQLRLKFTNGGCIGLRGPLASLALGLRTLVGTGSCSTAVKELPASLFFFITRKIKKLGNGAEMSGAETPRRQVFQCWIGGAESAAPKLPSPNFSYHPKFNFMFFSITSSWCEVQMKSEQNNSIRKSYQSCNGKNTWAKIDTFELNIVTLVNWQF